MKFKKLLYLIERFLPLILVCAFIFIESSKKAVSVSSSGGTDFFIHKLAHVVLYASLFLTAVRAFKNKKIALIFTIIYAISDEFHQIFTPTRTPALRDVLIDSLSASYVYYLITKYSKKLPQVLKNFIEM
jgi:VanZ family protein